MSVIEIGNEAGTRSAEKAEKARTTQWFHSIDLGDGVVTTGEKPLDQLEAEADRVFKYPVAGRTVLDIGAWDGFFSFEAKRRGAARVLATDWFCWSGPGWGSKRGFEIARECTGLAVDDMEIDVPDVAPETVGTWDVVLLLGVFYHLKNPFAAVERIARVVREMLVLETHIDLRLPAEPPAMVFYPGDELAGDWTNWWGPNESCVASMLKICGFGRIEVSRTSNYHRSLFHAFRE